MPTQKTTNTFHALENRVLNAVRKHVMIHSGDLVLLAVSGGADSIALLRCLQSLRRILQCRLAVAHLNHCLRGEESDGDEAFVRRMSDELEIPFVSEVAEVKMRASSSGENLEQLAREVRYEFLRRTASEMGAQRVATGHTQNDQMETAIFRFLRGSGMEGLAGIYPVVDGYVIRPLLECTRADILEYLEQQGCGYREDSSNEDIDFSRNRIRQELVPYLEKHFNPGLGQTITRVTSLMRENWDFMKSQAEKAFEEISHPVEDGIALLISEIETLHPALQKEVLRLALKHFRGDLKNIGWEHIRSILSLCLHAQSGESIDLPENLKATRQFDLLVLSRDLPDTSPDYRYELSIPGYCYVAEARIGIYAEINGERLSDAEKENLNVAFLDSSGVSSPLIVRNRLAGDRYGGPGHRKVKKMLIDRKIPLAQRHSLPMVVSGENVIWIPGFKPAKAYTTSNLTQTYLRLEARRELH